MTMIEYNREELRDQIQRVIGYSQELDPSTLKGIDNWLDIWEKNKARFYKWFGNKLIYEIDDVQFSIAKDQCESVIETFQQQLFESFPILTKYEYDEDMDRFTYFLSLNKESFFDNTVTNLIPSVPEIKLGMKITKAFKYFFPNECLEGVQILASQYIQKNKCNGTLCFSIHPLDFLSASENTYNWRSCHALNGEFRAGNVSYMLDQVTFCCYLKGDNDVILPRFPETVPWNSKKWRMWAHVNTNDKSCFLGRQYPFFSDNIFGYMRKFLNSISNPPPAQEDYWWIDAPTWTQFSNDFARQIQTNNNNPINIIGNQLILFDSYGPKLVPLNKIVKSGKQSLMYNDILHSSVYTPYYSFKQPVNNIDIEELKIVIGRKVPCACCEMGIAPETNSFLCNGCYDGEQNEDELVYTVANDIVEGLHNYAQQNEEVEITVLPGLTDNTTTISTANNTMYTISDDMLSEATIRNHQNETLSDALARLQREIEQTILNTNIGIWRYTE